MCVTGYFYLLPDFNITLMTMNTSIAVLEPDTSDTALASSCFTAYVFPALRRSVLFELILPSNSSTATFSVDYQVNRNSSYIIIRAGFEGIFVECVNITIIGDNIIEPDEEIAYDVRPLMERDEGLFSSRIIILDNDGMVGALLLVTTKWHFKLA